LLMVVTGAFAVSSMTSWTLACVTATGTEYGGMLGFDVNQSLLLRLSLNRDHGLDIAVDGRRRRLRGLVDDKLDFGLRHRDRHGINHHGTLLDTARLSAGRLRTVKRLG
jgi:hypothetical protein